MAKSFPVGEGILRPLYLYSKGPRKWGVALAGGGEDGQGQACEDRDSSRTWLPHLAPGVGPGAHSFSFRRKEPQHLDQDLGERVTFWFSLKWQLGDVTAVTQAGEGQETRTLGLVGAAGVGLPGRSGVVSGKRAGRSQPRRVHLRSREEERWCRWRGEAEKRRLHQPIYPITKGQ